MSTVPESAPALRPEATETAQWVTFRMGAQEYGVPVEAVQEVVRVPEIAPVPGAPRYMLGVMNLRGAILAVIDGRARFNMPDGGADDDQRRLLVLRLTSCTCGMLVDCVTDVVDLAVDEIQPVDAVELREPDSPINGVVYRDNGFLVLVDTASLAPKELT